MINRVARAVAPAVKTDVGIAALNGKCEIVNIVFC